MLGRVSRARLLVCALVGLAVLLREPRSIQAQPEGLPVPQNGPILPRIELWTIGESPVVWSTFGHSALCVFDRSSPEGRCFNYGTGDFDDIPGLVEDFLRHRAMFWVSLQSVDDMIADYEEEDRSLWRQVLPLDLQQVEALTARLEADLARPGHGRYAYDHRYDNCTSRVRDHLGVIYGARLRAGLDRPYPRSWHQLLEAGLVSDPLVGMLGELLLARAGEDHPSLWEAAFQPGLLRRLVEQRLGAAPELVYERAGPPVRRPATDGRKDLGLLALALAALIGALMGVAAATGQRGLGRVALVILGLGLGLAACVVWAMSLYATVPDLSWNEVSLVLWPTDLLLVGLRRRALSGYLTARLLGLALVLIAMAVGLLVQPLGPALALAGLPLLVARVGLWRPR
jgi:hypothetical protein